MQNNGLCGCNYGFRTLFFTYFLGSGFKVFFLGAHIINPMSFDKIWELSKVGVLLGPQGERVFQGYSGHSHEALKMACFQKLPQEVT